ncbi:uncharacterized protein LOC131855055 [Achroia grisella]|uniref:uncharacterized protein LOC131855055 n=1 Tax=Achroia grisella TaxID=688607 RepID=UPI0027D34961|nr:uncharacterized protein LOC131855055 [Achroia grisella]
MAFKFKKTKKTADSDFGLKTTLDNTAPLNQIVKDLYNREFQGRAYGLYFKLLGHRRNNRVFYKFLYHSTLPGHPLNAFTENFDGDIGPEFFEEFTYKSLMPKMITKLRNVEKTDPVTELLRQRADWRKKIRAVRNVHLTKYSRLKIEKCNEEVIQCPKYIVELAELLQQDPDPNFRDCYNWYYSGSGNLQLVSIKSVEFLLHSEFCNVYLSSFTRNNLTIDFQNAVSYSVDNDILETICSTQNIVVLRTKYKVFILQIVEQEDKLLFKKLRSFQNELPFTGISFDKYHKNILYATTLDCKLSIINIDRMTKRSLVLKENPTLEDNLNYVIGAERGFFMHIQKDSISAYDKRTNKAVNTWSGLKSIVDEITCNEIKAALQPEDSYGLYFTTQHHLFLMDTRFYKESKMKAIQRWTHGMHCVPTYISIQNVEFNKDYIFLSSQWCEDLCIVSNYSDRLTRYSDINGLAIPYRPPSIFNVLDDAQQKLLCWDLQNPIVKRLPTAITGKVEVQQGNNWVILMHNSLGDISSHVLYPTYMENLMDDNALQNLHEWSKDYKFKRKIFEVTGVHDISHIWKELREVTKEELDTFLHADQPPRRIIDEKEIYSAFEKEELMPELLEVWKNGPINNGTADDLPNILNSSDKFNYNMHAVIDTFRIITTIYKYNFKLLHSNFC